MLRTEVLALKLAPTPLNDVNADASQPPKKKRKTATKVVSDRLDLRTLVNNLRSGGHHIIVLTQPSYKSGFHYIGPSLPALKDSLDVLTSLRILQHSNTGCVNSETDEAILIPNIKRSIVALGNLIAAILSRNASVIMASSRVDVTSCLCNLLLALLQSTLPLRARHSILPHILGDLTMLIIRPIIQSFHSISVHELTSGLKEPGRKSAAPDIRPDLLSLVKRLIECLCTLKARTRQLREFVIFETVKEIESLWGIEDSKKATTSERTREHRIGKLARKDSLWYHCSILHVALDQLPPSTASDTGDTLLSSAAVQVLAGLIKRFDSQIPVDIVARGMMLAVVEKAWLSDLHGLSTEGEGSI